ncbi:hypothetical protein J2046_002449 [Rhizobium petrolearium]|uniref:hypothetical protein n=1 Tax=Neorhizobium petrolearium TaxID=515361 RepID=UPI001F30E328|nr:hypothetical protein [Neorhizobium petrolearium]MBP1844191.1 hypothetical protein [Neorhizobium petrolearium]
MDFGDLMDQRYGLRYPLQPSSAFQKGNKILKIGVAAGNWDIGFHPRQIQKKKTDVFALAQIGQGKEMQTSNGRHAFGNQKAMRISVLAFF